MKHPWNSLFILLSCLCLGGCLGLIRRPPAPDTAGTGKAGNQPATTEVQEEEPPSSSPQAAEKLPDPEETLPATENMGQKTVEQPVQNKIVQVHRPKRNRRQQEAIKQINEYAFWCIENNMWTEARLHLEQGLQQDSLSASIHNNLGIVYERLGLQEKAAAAYVKARSLNQKKQAYQINLQLFDRRQQAGRIDSVEAQTKAVEDLSDPFASDGNRTHPPERTGE